MGGPAWLLCVVLPGPRAVWRDRGRTHLLGLRGWTWSLCLRLRLVPMGAGGLPSADGPVERRVAPARSIAINYNVSSLWLMGRRGRWSHVDNLVGRGRGLRALRLARRLGAALLAAAFPPPWVAPEPETQAIG